jgi:hypothetical protein
VDAEQAGQIEIRDRIAEPFFALNESSATTADPEPGTISVPGVRTVVVLPAPLGSRKPNTSRSPTSNETSSNATRSPNRLFKCSTMSADSPLEPPRPGATPNGSALPAA